MIVKRKIVIAPLLVGLMLALTGASGDMTVASFLAKADALREKGVMALGSPDIGLLRDHAKAGSEAYRAKIDADLSAGRTAHSCPPPKGKSQISSDDLITHMRSYKPKQRQRTTVKAAIFDLMKQRYPCK